MNAYTYLIGWTAKDKFYYGAQWNKNADPRHLWTEYFTSSNKVKKFRLLNGEPDIVEVRKTFGDDASACREWEERVLMKLKKNKHSLWLNTRANNKGWFSPTGSVVARNIVTGVVSRVTTDEFRANPDLVGQTKGMVSALNAETGEREYVTQEQFELRNDLLFHSEGRVIGDEQKRLQSQRMAGCVNARPLSGDTICVSASEFAARNDLVGPAHGHRHTNEAKKKISDSKLGKSRPQSVKDSVSRASKGMVTAKDLRTGVAVRVSKGEFHSNPNLVGSSAGSSIDAAGRNRRAEALRGKTSGMVTAKDLRTGVVRKVPREVFDSDPYLVGSRSRAPLVCSKHLL